MGTMNPVKSSTEREKAEAKKAELRDKISRLEETLELMPEDTFLGRVCIMGYLKKFKKELSNLEEQWT